MISRERKLLRINQAHLAPGMNLDRWQQILRRHNIPLSDRADVWEKVPDETIEAIWNEIAGIVQRSKDQP